MSTKICGVCKEIINSNERLVPLSKKSYHEKCLVCSVCKTPLTVHSTMSDHEKLYCNNHYSELKTEKEKKNNPANRNELVGNRTRATRTLAKGHNPQLQHGDALSRSNPNPSIPEDVPPPPPEDAPPPPPEARLRLHRSSSANDNKKTKHPSYPSTELFGGVESTRPTFRSSEYLGKQAERTKSGNTQMSTSEIVTFLYSNYSIPTVVALCDSTNQKRKIDRYLERGKKIYNTESIGEILEKIFSESAILNKEPIEDTKLEEENTGSVVWEWKNNETWISYPEDCQEILENVYQKGEQDSVTLPIKEGPSLFNMWKDVTNSIAVELSQMRQINKLNGSINKVRRHVKKIYQEGWIISESKNLKIWRQHYLVLSSEVLQCFFDDYKINEGHGFIIPLQALMNVTYEGTYGGKENVFKIQTLRKIDHIYYLSAPTEAAAKTWVYNIGLALKKFLISKARSMLVIRPDISQSLINQEIGRYSICFCSISTAAYKFDLDIASTIACDVFKEFLSKHPKAPVTIYLVDREQSRTLELFTQKKPHDDRFKVVCANLVKLKDKGIPCWYIVNASNPKFSEGGSGTNEAIHEACRGIYTPTLQNITRKKYGEVAELSEAYSVPLPEGCPLRETQGVRYVVHVVGPNMNPKRPNYLGDDDKAKEKGKEELKKCYWNVLNRFWELSGLTD